MLSGSALHPGAAFEMPPPRGSVVSLHRVADRRLLAQVSGRRWLLDAANGATLAEGPASLEHWHWPPVQLGGSLVAVLADRQTVEVLDATTGKVAWRRRLSPSSLMSSEAPVVVAADQKVIFVESLNVGLRLRCLDRVTGKELWPRPLFVEGRATNAWIAGEALYHAGNEGLTARSLHDGALRWHTRFVGADEAQMTLAGTTLLVRPRERQGCESGSARSSDPYNGAG